MLYRVGISCFAFSLKVWEKISKHSFVQASSRILVFKEVRFYYLIYRQNAPNNDKRRVVESLIHIIRS